MACFSNMTELFDFEVKKDLELNFESDSEQKPKNFDKTFEAYEIFQVFDNSENMIDSKKNGNLKNNNLNAGIGEN